MKTIDTERTGLNLYFFLIENGVTVKQLAEHLGFNTPQSVYKWINNISLPSLRHMVSVCGLLGCTPDDLLVTVTNGKKDPMHNPMHKSADRSYLELDVPQTKRNLLSLRTEHHLSRYALSCAIGSFSEQSISKWEHTGTNTLPTIDHLLLLSEYYSVPLSKIIAVVPLNDTVAVKAA